MSWKNGKKKKVPQTEDKETNDWEKRRKRAQDTKSAYEERGVSEVEH